LKAEAKEPNFWADSARASRIMKEIDELQSIIEPWKKIEREIQDLIEMAELAKSDKEIEGEIEKNLKSFKKKFKKYEFQALLSGKYDRKGAILAIHAGSGGTEAQDWAEMLLRMYLRWAEAKKYKTRILDQSFGSEAGIKSVVLSINGLYAYGYLKAEAGVHRLVRLSPFDADHLRHTSFALVEVLPEVGDTEEIKINPEDLKIDTFRSSGPGGQSVNTTDSAVRITHLPTGIVAACQTERSQTQNKENAMKLLRAKLCQLMEKKEKREREKIRGEYISAEWARQIRSYILHPYKLVKDHRTKFETKNVEAVLDGKLDEFIEAYLRKSKLKTKNKKI